MELTSAQFISPSVSIQKAFENLLTVANMDSALPILVHGERGSGKTEFTRLAHAWSARGYDFSTILADACGFVAENLDQLRYFAQGDHPKKKGVINILDEIPELRHLRRSRPIVSLATASPDSLAHDFFSKRLQSHFLFHSRRWTEKVGPLNQALVDWLVEQTRKLRMDTHLSIWQVHERLAESYKAMSHGAAKELLQAATSNLGHGCIYPQLLWYVWSFHRSHSRIRLKEVRDQHGQMLRSLAADDWPENLYQVWMEPNWRIGHSGPVFNLVLVQGASLIGDDSDVQLFGMTAARWTQDGGEPAPPILGGIPRSHLLGGNLWLDEIGYVPLDIQSMLLTAIQPGEFVPRHGHQMNGRLGIIGSTWVDLREKVERRELLADLVDRMKAFIIRVPVLNDRREELPLIVERMLTEQSHGINARVSSVRDEFLLHLQKHGFPRRIQLRELGDCLRRHIARRKEREIELGEDDAKAVLDLMASIEDYSPTDLDKVMGHMLEASAEEFRKAGLTERIQEGKGGKGDLLLDWIESKLTLTYKSFVEGSDFHTGDALRGRVDRARKRLQEFSERMGLAGASNEKLKKSG